MKVQTIGALAVFALAIAACGGGGGGTASSGSAPVAVLPTAGPTTVAATTAPTTPATALPANYLVDKVTLSMAKGTYASSSARKTAAIGTGTESIVFTLLQQNGTPTTGTPQVFAVTASSPNCTVNQTTGILSCTLPLAAPIGQDVFLAQTYVNPDGTGSLTGSGAVALSVGQNTTNAASIVLNAQVAAVYVVAGNFYLGSPGLFSVARSRGAQAQRKVAVAQSPLPPLTSMPVFVVAVDSSGNTILNPSAYNAPLYLQLAFDPGCGANSCNGYTTGTADVTLSVTYGNNDPSPCTPNTTTTVNSWYASFPICSPSDSVTASLSPNGGTNPSYIAYVYGYILSSMLTPTPAPSASPAPLPTPVSNSYAYIYVYSSPAPTPTPAGGSITVIGQ